MSKEQFKYRYESLRKQLGHGMITKHEYNTEVLLLLAEGIK